MGGNISRDPTNDHTQPHRYNSVSLSSAATRRAKTSASKNSKSNSVHEPAKPDKVIGDRTYHNIESSSYMLPKDDAEIDRLHEEHFVTKEVLGYNIMTEAFKKLDFHSDSLRVLDVCCGPATWLCETSLDYPMCNFTGIDMCRLWPQVIRPNNVDFAEANVLEGIPYPDKTFDFVHMRFVVLAFKTNEWPFVISEIKRVLKDGGLFQCVELDMRIETSDPTRNPTVSQHTEAFEMFCASHGLDASAGEKLDVLLKTGGGMNMLESEYKTIPLGWGGPIGCAYIEIYLSALDGLSPWLKPAVGTQKNELRKASTYPGAQKNELRKALTETKSFMGLHAYLVQKPMID